MLLRVTLAVENPDIREKLATLLKKNDVLTQITPDHMLKWESLQPFPTDILILSESIIPTPINKHLLAFTEKPHAASVILLSTDELDETQHASMQAIGINSVLSSKLDINDIGVALSTILDNEREILNNLIIARRSVAQPHLSDFISQSKSMQSFLKVVNKMVDSDSNLLITGETGVGKERLARAMHTASRRADGPFISVNCGAIPENLMESELFGHIKGSFTGAQSNKRGCFELAHGGILFLDEISEMPLNLQVKLLHVLQDFNIRPVGSEKVIPVDTRVIAATNRNLQSEMEEKRFRNDLYYRLSILTITVPPLRDRKEDIPDLIESLLTELSTRICSNVTDIAPEAIDSLYAYDWPGNVRELINVVERAILLADTTTVEVSDLPEEISGIEKTNLSKQSQQNAFALTEESLNRPLKEAKRYIIEEYERKYLAEMLAKTNGRIDETARRAGIVTRSLFTKMKKYGLSKEDFK